jgi:hypothetical protein
MTDTRCDLVVLDERLAVIVARRPADELDVTVSVVRGRVPDRDSEFRALIARSEMR